MNWFIFILFFISGACGLIYEVVWSRMMQQIFGKSILAVGIVLAAFMLGLALGSYLLGKYSDRSRNPLRLYAIYEIGIGLAALGATILLTRLLPLYIWAHTAFGEESMALIISQFLIAFVPLIIPTLLMGATLPVLSRIVIGQLSGIERELGRLYAINTVGAVAGSLASGFFLIRILGVHGTIYVAVAGNVTVGVLAWLASRRCGSVDKLLVDSSPEPPFASLFPKDAETRHRYLIILGVFALSGFASFAYEVFWTRTLVLLVGNTTYAFSLMLTAFLSGIALGGYIIRFVARRFRNPMKLFALIEVLIGVLSAASLPLLFFIVHSPNVRSFLGRMSTHLGVLALSEFGLALFLMLIPATLIGATFPLVGRMLVNDLSNTGMTVGKIYAVNTIGNVLGALLPGLVIIPFLGVQKGILFIAALNICLGIVVAISRVNKSLIAAVAMAIVFIGIALGITGVPTKFQFPSEDQKAMDAVFYYREGGLATTKVWQDTDLDYKSISVDGINIGGTSNCDYKQQLLAHLPKLLQKSYHSELSIGLGSGILAGESLRHRGLEKMVCIELVRGVVEGARYFSEENFNVIDDPRTSIVNDDVTDFLNVSKERFDIISADEKTAGKYASNSMSYSKDYYSLLRKHLTPGGLVIQWMPTELPPSQYFLAMRTFLDAFPHVTLWYFPPVGRFTMSNTVLVGSNDRIDIDPSRVRQALGTDPESFSGIRKYGLTTADAVLSHYVASEDVLRHAIPSGPINSFENPLYEFYSPGDYAVPSRERERVNHEWLLSVRGQDFAKTVRNDTQETDDVRVKSAYQAEGAFLTAYTRQLEGETSADIVYRYGRALGIAPWDTSLRNEIVAYFYQQARAYLAQGDNRGAEESFRNAAGIYVNSAEVHYDYAKMLLYINAVEKAGSELQQALQLNPKYAPALRDMGSLYASFGRMDKAAEYWQKTLTIDRNEVKTLVFYGDYLFNQGQISEGRKYLQMACKLAPDLSSQIPCTLN